MPGITNKKICTSLGAREAKWKIGTIVKKIDVFGQEVPSFNIKGQTKINTIFGGTITVLIILTTFAYAILQSVKLLGKKNPTIM
jgi:hypothetical protein